MIATGLHSGTVYELTRTPSGVRLVTRGGAHDRADLLAQALRARAATRPRAYFLTPARAEKWRALFMAGFTARRCMVAGIVGWGFEIEGRTLGLREAMKVARGLAL